MTTYIIRRLIQTLIVVFALTFVSYAMMGLMPGDPLDIACQANPHCTPENLEQMKKNLGLDQPIHVRYLKWLGEILQGELGYSRTYRLPVTDILGPRLLNTIWLGLASTCVSFIIAIPLGVFTSLRANTKFDYALNLGAFAGISLPSFWLALMLIIIFAVKLGIMPAGGTETVGLEVHLTGFAYVLDRLKYLALPVTSLSLLTIAYWVRFTRAKMLETMRNDYIRTARAKGLSEKRVIYLHGLRNAMIPVVTVVAVGLSGIVSGAVITETVFAYQGAGKLIFDSIIANDYNVAMCSFIITSFMVLMMNLFADIAMRGSIRAFPTAEGIAVAAIETKASAQQAKSMTRIAFEQLLEHRLAVVSMFVIAGFCSVAIGADVISWALGLDPDAQDILNRYGPWSAEHWLGTDEVGRDVLIRLVYGTRISLLVAFTTTISSTVIGVLVGAIAGYYGKFIDAALMRVTDSLLALPITPILIIIASIDNSHVPFFSHLSPQSVSIVKMIFVLMIFSWMVQARLVRGEVLAIKEQEYILAAQTSGLSGWKIILKELLPNVMSPVIVSVTLSVGGAILFESALSFLGLGIQPPTPSWGNMLNNAQEIIYSAPLLAVIPGLLILMVVISFNFLGDGLQDALDPKAIRR